VIGTVSRLRRVELLFQTEADRRMIVGSRTTGVVIPGVGVDTVRFIPGGLLPSPPYVIVYLGRAVQSKGLTDLALAVADRPVENIELHLYCALDISSPGSLTAEEMTQIKTSQGITVHEPTSDPAAVLGRSHGAILPSRAGEGVSKFVLEALACGLPVLLSAQSGSAEVVDPPRTGLAFQGGDPESIRSALSEFAKWDVHRWARASAACRREAEQRFGLDVILPQIVELHRSVVGGSK
jgi:glycosyltransferase involved in cell wall biosynthesis